MLMVYSVEQTAQWDAAVRSMASYDVYYLSGYVKAFQIHGDGEPLLFYYEGDGLRGINVVMKRDIAKAPQFAGKLEEGRWFDLATPYGYGGWLLEGDGDSTALYAAYEAWCNEHAIVSEFVRFHPVLKNHIFAQEAYEVIALGNTIAMDLTSNETIWTNIISKNRNMIRKAQKNNIRICHGSNKELYQVFREIYNATMDKDHATDYYYFAPDFYESVRCDLPENAEIFYAQMEDGTIIAASIMLSANGYMNYHLSGSRRDYQHLAPTNLLLYEAALWGCANGCRSLHLGGGVGSGEDSLYKFKRAFYREEPLRYHIGKKIFSQEKYQELVEMRTDLPESGFFPRYRA
ncbi:MAG: peptidoglycan bridge formation glycyltransferase FemA/FemB family protein [Ruminococcaceae bacterium]|nr:peptidoglycan bridge formation glycyltransferase FemA/FemB family protein [Oscillospiraceae bacterium]